MIFISLMIINWRILTRIMILGRYMSLVPIKGYASATASMSLSGPQSQVLKYALYSISKGFFFLSNLRY